MVPSLRRALRRPDSTPTADPYLPRCSFKGPWDGRQLLHVQQEEVRLPGDRLLLGADVDHIHISRNVVKRDLSIAASCVDLIRMALLPSPPVGEGGEDAARV